MDHSRGTGSTRSRAPMVKYIVTIVVKFGPDYIGPDKKYQGKRVRADVPMFPTREAAQRFADSLPPDKEPKVEERYVR